MVSFYQVHATVGHGDFSRLSFTAAFDSLFINISTCYPFTDWKAIDWRRLYNEYAPRIADAQRNNNTAAYTMALRRFIHSIPDGHVRIAGDFQALFFGEIGGGIGLTLIKLDDGSIAVNRVLTSSPAKQAGIEVGAVISRWNGLPVNDALQNTDIIWEGKPPATLEATRLAQIRRLIRMPVGTPIEITFSNPGQSSVTKSLTAVDDGMETWNITQYTKFRTNGSVDLSIDDILKPVEYRILPSGYGYLKNRILVEMDMQGNIMPAYNNIYNSIKEAIDYFNVAHVPGVIIDIRDNPGGYDKLAALFGSFFMIIPNCTNTPPSIVPKRGNSRLSGRLPSTLNPKKVIMERRWSVWSMRAPRARPKGWPWRFRDCPKDTYWDFTGHTAHLDSRVVKP